MKFPESWLRSFCNPSMTTDELAHALTMAGLEVEDVAPAAPPFTGIVVGEIMTREKHPNADRLSVCTVNVGSHAAAPLQIVCGAPNARVGIKIPCALVGAALPPGADGKPFMIKRAKMRDVESNGMLCSARELGISDAADGLLELAADAPVGEDIREFLKLNDSKFEIKLTPNKADCLSVYGVARELHAITGAPLVPEAKGAVSVTLNDVLPVKVLASDLCGRFAGRVIRGVNAKAPTPAWMRERLEKSGQRSITALVDISNYVMLEVGRPTHVFDLDKVHGALEVRWGRAGETLKLLNGNTVQLDDKVGVIADERAVESLAGIMGGDSTSVSDDTQNVYVEAAFWHPLAIQGRSRRFNFSTDAGHRFERGVDWETIPAHLDRISALILEICGGQAGPIDDQIVNVPARPPVTMRIARAQKVIGVNIAADEMAAIFTRLGLLHTRTPQTFTVTPPSYRFDIEIEEDLIEEIARIYGFDNIPALPPMARAAMRSKPEATNSLHDLRARIAAADYYEVINYSFVDESWERDIVGNGNPIKLLNPIASQMAVMRSSLVPGLLANVRHNASHKADEVRVFELGKVFVRDAGVADGALSVEGVAQPLKLAGLAWGSALPEQWGATKRAVDFFDVKSDIAALLPHGARFDSAAHPLLHPGRGARISVNGAPIGWLGELHPKHLAAFELTHAPIVFELDVSPLLARPLPDFKLVAKTPMVRRDFALVVENSVNSDALLSTLRSAVPAHTREIVIFDVYRGAGLADGQKSVAIRVLMQDTERTLTETEIEQACQTMLAAAKAAHGAALRV
ncbi:MAG: phenylalanine--tRNA ligase subunit beta [Betaproteobacteria bacterium]|nr:MAG: phenylalanine--tRNA ligase subunit beta [Betaproteobacteria bacterium]